MDLQYLIYDYHRDLVKQGANVKQEVSPESILLIHHNNPRSMAILVNEFMGMFNSANLYTNEQLIEQLLTAWRDDALDIPRISTLFH
ncbi:hypothetical protein BARVI_12515 [Barnesiella viscericola DSM 18177]|uniref:Uncharacterized protein n=1 Tax=Barnesiella viscericola DSM 18177 TaxID=880074 RepID=W0EXS3_9BACT|nr:hypothetical protein [Barnesiella viscericola]AHF13999.1 hypothetical protein BARVI_12515 [Barnesiella viscericola DSM 18177]